MTSIRIASARGDLGVAALKSPLNCHCTSLSLTQWRNYASYRKAQ